MKKIGFIGAYDKSNFIIYIAKILQKSDYKVLVIDASETQKIKYLVPSINPTKSYITSFEDIDFAVGFENWKEIEKYLGSIFITNDNESGEAEEKQENIQHYDYILLNIDSSQKIDDFDVENFDKNYFLTSFDVYSLRKGLSIFENLKIPMQMTKLFFSYENSKEDEIFFNYLFIDAKITWNEYTIYFPIYGADNQVFEINQRLEKVSYRNLSKEYKNALTEAAVDITESRDLNKIKKALKD